MLLVHTAIVNEMLQDPEGENDPTATEVAWWGGYRAGNEGRRLDVPSDLGERERCEWVAGWATGANERARRHRERLAELNATRAMMEAARDWFPPAAPEGPGAERERERLHDAVGHRSMEW